MPRARIGKLFHLTPLVDDLAPAEYFFNSLFAPLTMMRNYAELWHRHAAIYVINETSIEPMHCLAREPGSGQEETSWYRYAERFGPRVHNMAFYVYDSDDLAERLEAAGVRITDAGSGTTVFCHPKDTPGMLEFHPATGGHWENGDPRFQPTWKAFADSYWPQHPLGYVRTSHITVVTGDLDVELVGRVEGGGDHGDVRGAHVAQRMLGPVRVGERLPTRLEAGIGVRPIAPGGRVELEHAWRVLG